MKRILIADRNRLQDPSFNGRLTVFYNLFLQITIFTKSRAQQCIVSNRTRPAFKIVATTHRSATYIQYPKQIEKELIEAKGMTEKEQEAVQEEIGRDRVKRKK